MELREATSLYEVFAARAGETPTAVAVTDGDTGVSYGALLAAAEQVRDRLAEAGVRPGELVGISLERGWRVPAAILAVLAHGCGYVPLDPAYPGSRLRFMAEDSGIRAVVADDATDDLPAEAIRVGAGPLEPPAARQQPARPAERGDTPAYVIYTSGSTGTPKGVPVPQQAVLELFRSCHDLFEFRADDVWSWFHSYSFDFSVWEIWGALLFGGRVVVVPADTAKSPPRLLQLLATEHVTVLSQVPSAFKYLTKYYERRPADLALRYVVFGGEALDRPSVRRWLELRPGAETLVNMYGITETTVHVTYRRVTPEDVAGDTGGTRIGLPLPHLGIALLDPEGRPVAPGEPGEIHVRGSSLALGYLHRPDLTGERFPTLSIGGTTERWYRAGDVARELPDGELEYVGRNDRQVNLRGFRIELGEIEAALRERAEIDDAVVEPEPSGDDTVLVAYVAIPGGTDPDRWQAELLELCEASLPAHFVPQRFTVLPSLPLTPSGKLDRAALTAPAGDPVAAG